MRRAVWILFGVFIMSLLIALGMQARQRKPRVYVTDSVSWEISGGWGVSEGSGGGGVRGGARPQTAEIIKTFGERCPEIVVNDKKDLADFVVILDHEGGKGLARKKNKIAVFNRSGDSIFSDSTRSLGNSVKNACNAIVTAFQNNAPYPGSVSAWPVHESPAASPAAAGTPGASRAAGEDLASVTVKSTPDGADITVDGKFVGNTPSTLRLPAGDHTFSVAAAGRKPWERTLALAPGSDVTLNAVLGQGQ